MSNISPHLQVLSQDQMSTGIRVESKTARRIFEKSHAVNLDNDLVYIQEELVNHAIKQAPSNITSYTRNGDIAFQLGRNQGNNTHLGIS